VPLAHYNGQVIFFAHVPKTGGSSVEEYLIRRFGPLSLIDRNKQRGVRGTGLIVPTTHLTAVDLAELIPPDVAYSFTVVRDPVARLMSEYRYQTNVSWMSRLGFSTWLRVMLHAARTEPRLHENHIRPQNDLVPEGTVVFHLENGFDAMTTQLDKITGSSAPNIKVGHWKPREHKEIPLKRQDAELISEFYAADYARFGYILPNISQLPSDSQARLRSFLTRILAWVLVRKQRRTWVH